MDMSDEEKLALTKKIESFRGEWRDLVDDLEEMLPSRPQDALDVDIENDSLEVLALKKSLLMDFKALIQKASTPDATPVTSHFKDEIKHEIDTLKGHYESLFLRLGSKLPETFNDCVQDYDDVMLFHDKYGIVEAINKMRERELS